MTDNPPIQKTRRNLLLIGLVAIILLAGIVGVAYAVRNSYGFRFRGAAEIYFEEFLELKSKETVKEVWIDGHDLYVEMWFGYIRNGQNYRYLHTQVPASSLTDPKEFEELRKGLDPSRFTYTPQR